jgi:hypothetical protein
MPTSTAAAPAPSAPIIAWTQQDERNARAWEALVADAEAGRLNDFTSSLHSFGARRGYLTPNQRDALLRGLDKRAQREATQPTRTGSEPVEPGVYEKDGVVYKVQRSRESGGLYAKQLVEIGGERLTELGMRVNAEYQYVRGVIYSLSAEDKLSLERAKELTLRYGFCVACGRHLKAAQSVEDGIGPVCRTRLA